MKVFMSGRTAINPNFIKGCIGIAEIKPGLATVCSETAVCLLKRGIADNEFCAGSGFILQNRNTVKVGRTAFNVHFTAAVDFQVKHADFLIVVFVNRPNPGTARKRIVAIKRQRSAHVQTCTFFHNMDIPVSI